MIDFLNVQTDELRQDLSRIHDEISRLLFLPKKIKVNLEFVTEERIRELNRTTRNIDAVTDVLSYPYTELRVGEKLKLSQYKFDLDPVDATLTIGDIFICENRASEQAKTYGHSFRREVCFLFCHGMLHLCGYDHIEKQDEEIMTNMQKKVLDNLNITRDIAFKSGFVTIIGETNVGKSTLINTLVGERVAIVSPKTQTTRENITGIYNDDNAQIVFLDTPGYHKRANKVDDVMDKHIANAQLDTEIVLMLISAKKPLLEQYNNLIKRVTATAKKILIINKIDEVKYEKLYPQLAELSSVAKVDEILPLSALKGKNCDVLIDMIKNFLPTYDHEMRYYPVDEYTDRNLRHMCAEIIREKALLLLDDEIPHGVQVVVTDYRENETPIHIFVDLYCEKEGHKAIILGKNGSMIKEISTKSRISIEKLVGDKVNLEIFVKVKANWRNDDKAIIDFGLNVEE